ncbi:unnamed protein product [Rotaria socialis]|uniref:J domain-containing protein n=2 Tax=Rotaria socialis TaxID=392032 RepID=A0A821PPB5_9BILA|nr:unnamed protein product [Rotaria socialis]
MMQLQRREIFKSLLEREVFIYPDWKPYVSKVFDAGILSTEILMDTPREVISRLQSIPQAPLDRLLKLATNLLEMTVKNLNSTYSQPLSSNRLVTDFEFVPAFTYLQYLKSTPLTDKENELKRAIAKVDSIDYATDGLLKHEAVFLALYCQESSNRCESFYTVVNRAVKNRDSENFLNSRSALYILDSCFRHLPSIETVAWHGMNTAPNLSKFQIGGTVCFSGICSSSTDKDVAATLMEMVPRSPDHKRTLYKLNIKKGNSIKTYNAFGDEKEVVVGFCSKWKVLSVETNKYEIFSFGEYQCDYFVELEQLDSEPLFAANVKLRGLDLLAKIDYHSLETIIENSLNVFMVDFISQLDDRAKEILQQHLPQYWDEMSQCFKDCILYNVDAREQLKNCLVGLSSLVEEFDSNKIDVKRGLFLCDSHEIYNSFDLLYVKAGEVRSINDFVSMGFTNAEAEKLFCQEEHREELVRYYAMANLKGTFDSPKIVSTLMKNLRLMHYIKRDGLVIGLSGLARISVRGAKYALTGKELGYFQLLSYRIMNKVFIYNAGPSDYIVAGVILAIQVGSYSLQLWHGDITSKQFLKAICVSVVDTIAGCFGSAAGMLTGYVLATLIGGPVTASIAIGTIVGGCLVGYGAQALSRCFIEKYCCDGDEEEINAQRKWYLNALNVLNCLPDTTLDNVRRSYYRLAQANHPDKCPDKEAATAKFQSIVVAFEIVKSYHEVLNESCEILNMKLKDINVNVLEQWKAKNTQAIQNNEKIRRAYRIVYRQVAYTSDNWKGLRAWLDGDQKLSLQEPKLAIPFST